MTQSQFFIGKKFIQNTEHTDAKPHDKYALAKYFF